MREMNVDQWVQKGDALVQSIAAAEGQARYGFREQLHRVIVNIRLLDDPVPKRFLDLDHILLEEEAEDRFDNFPV
ncbi:MAG: hypothetical protein ACU0A6_04530 [Shimia sp.]|uniref:hypothetical protein n=1 Tax=Shimia sp. TaxID=1954381 RepID=UPI0040596C37